LQFFQQAQFESKAVLMEFYNLMGQFQGSSSSSPSPSSSSISMTTPPDIKNQPAMTASSSKTIQESLDKVMARQHTFATDVERLKTAFLAKGGKSPAEVKRNFALESLNAEVVSIGDTKLLDNGYYFYVFNLIENIFYQRGPQIVLHPSNHPGQCFPFKPDGDATIVIRLMDKVKVDSVSLVHITAAESPTGKVDSAPKEFSVYGLDHVDQKHPFKFGIFRYELDDQRPMQTFKFDKRSTKGYQLIKFVIHSNHGNDRRTCLYQVMVHGDLEQK
jgi:Sad1 / UNC-like C-terminal